MRVRRTRRHGRGARYSTEVSASWKPGQTVGRYRLLGCRGAGGMGEVWAAEDRELRRRVALKRLLSERNNPDAIARFEREARSLAALSNDHIASLYGVERDDDGEPYLVMELVEGRSLRELLADRPLPVDEALRIFAQIVAALSAAHRAGLVHRDLKPSNVIVREDGFAVLVDFGIARPADDDVEDTLTREGAVVGSAAYMSPQQAQGKRVGPEADVWSAGVTLFRMLTGELPFDGESSALTIASVLRDEPRSLRDLRPDVPRGLERLVLRCLSKDVRERPRDGAELMDLLPAIPLAPISPRGALLGPELIARAAAHPPLPDRSRMVAVVFALLAFVIGTAVMAGKWRGYDAWTRPGQAEAIAARLLGDAAVELPYVVSGNFTAEDQPGTFVRLGRESFHRDLGVPRLDLPAPVRGEVDVALTETGTLWRYEWLPDDDVLVDVDREAILAAADLTDIELHASTLDERVRGHEVRLLRGEDGIAFALAEHDGRVLLFERRDLPPIGIEVVHAKPYTGSLPGLVLLALVVGLAIAQYRRGRGDLRGALITGAIAGVLTMLDVVASPLTFIHGGWKAHLAQASGVAVIVSASYYGVEPIVRQHWPGALTGWERLIHWRTGGHVLGRELLLGAAATLPATLVVAFQITLGDPELPLRQVTLWSVTGPSEFAFVSFGLLAGWLFVAFTAPTLASIVLTVSRVQLLAELAAAIPVALFISRNLVRPTVPLAIVTVVAIIVLLRRGGLMSLLSFCVFLTVTWGSFPVWIGGWAWPFATMSLAFAVGLVAWSASRASRGPVLPSTIGAPRRTPTDATTETVEPDIPEAEPTGADANVSL